MPFWSAGVLILLRLITSTPVRRAAETATVATTQDVSPLAKYVLASAQEDTEPAENSAVDEWEPRECDGKVTRHSPLDAARPSSVPNMVL